MWEQGSQDPLTWMGFSMSPSHRDTSGTVNGFHTGSSVYLITCRAVRGKGGLGPGGSSVLGSGQPRGDGQWQEGETHSHTSEEEVGIPVAGRTSHHHAPLGPAWL